ncbi:MAG: ADP-forming succinate--CoA ligase subunit beta [Acidobacteria bacterium]|nr:ADP-forming succinate--CoA ligase subunit beta [Acidobacteriota bacterium]
MDLFEYQGKQVLARFGVPVPEGKVAASPAAARQVAAKLGGKVVVKAQVQVGGRGKAGGIKVAGTPDEAEAAARAILGMHIKGHRVRRVLVERAGDIVVEYYASFMLDRSAKTFLGMASAKGGVDIEEVAATDPGAIARVQVDPLVGLRPYHVSQLMWGSGIAPEHHKAAGALLERLFAAFLGTDASLVEVNPLVAMAGGGVVALDAKVSIDDSAMFRHPDLEAMRDLGAMGKQERTAKERGIGNFVKLEGEVGVIGNGAGLTMSTLDVVAEAGGRPANFLDIGGGANAESMAAAIDLVFGDRKVRTLLVNIFGGITRCDLIAEGILGALGALGDVKKKIVVRLDGTNAEEGRAILERAAHPNIVAAGTMLEAAQRAVVLAGGRRRA